MPRAPPNARKRLLRDAQKQQMRGAAMVIFHCWSPRFLFAVCHAHMMPPLPFDG
jgi:hypothetical protein